MMKPFIAITRLIQGSKQGKHKPAIQLNLSGIRFGGRAGCSLKEDMDKKEY